MNTQTLILVLAILAVLAFFGTWGMRIWIAERRARNLRGQRRGGRAPRRGGPGPAPQRLHQENGFRWGTFVLSWMLMLAPVEALTALLFLILPIWMVVLVMGLVALGSLVFNIYYGLFAIDEQHATVLFFGKKARLVTGIGWEGVLNSRRYWHAIWEHFEELYNLEPQEQDFKVDGDDKQGVIVKGTRWIVQVQASYQIVDLWQCVVVHKGKQEGMLKWHYRLNQRIEGLVSAALGQLSLDEIIFMKRVMGDMEISGRAVVHHPIRDPHDPAATTPEEVRAAEIIRECVERAVRKILDDLGIQIIGLEIENVRSPEDEVMETLRNHELREKKRETAEEQARGERAKAEAAEAGRIAIMQRGADAGWDGTQTGHAAYGLDVHVQGGGAQPVVQAQSNPQGGRRNTRGSGNRGGGSGSTT